MKRHVPLERDVQKAIVDWLNFVLPKTYRVFAIPNAARRMKGGRAGNAAPGLRKGVPDLCIVGEGRTAFIEVKRPGGKLRDEQSEWGNWCVLTGAADWCCAMSLDDARAAVAHWGIPTKGSE
jgi:hypothetical protein